MSLRVRLSFYILFQFYVQITQEKINQEWMCAIKRKGKQSRYRVLWLKCWIVWIFSWWNHSVFNDFGSYNHLHGKLKSITIDTQHRNYHSMKSMATKKNKHDFYYFPTSLDHYKWRTSKRAADTRFVSEPFMTEHLHKTIQVFYRYSSSFQSSMIHH